MFEAIHFCAFDKQSNVSSSVNLSQKRFHIFTFIMTRHLFNFCSSKSFIIIIFKTITVRYESMEKHQPTLDWVMCLGTLAYDLLSTLDLSTLKVCL